MVDIGTIKKLRDETNHSISKCKEALEEAGGDTEKARNILRERGTLAAAKKADRELGAGVIQAYIHTNNRVGSMAELLCETDFVARNEEFIALARDIAVHCAAFQPRYLSRAEVPEEVMNQVVSELKEKVDAGKPPEIRETILNGMVDARMKEVLLLEQAFLKDDSRTVGSIIDESVQKFGERIAVGRFTVMTL